MAGSIVEGVFAIHKPNGISSAQVIREVQAHFKPSALFRPWLEREESRLREARKHMHKRSRKQRQPLEVKIGHGGTLDPMATGVLILGVGSGTKKMNDFITCTKSYDTVLLFGQATDTYDVLGKTIAKKPFEHITRQSVEGCLDKFRGNIMQRPPIYSALRVQGKRLYEYAREGKEVPVEIKERPVTVEKIEMLEWFDGGSHSYHWPKEEAEKTESAVAKKVLDIGESASPTGQTDQEHKDDLAGNEEASKSQKREREDDSIEASHDSKKTKIAEEPAADAKADTIIESSTENANTKPCPAPACRLRMTVTSGFYVRSLCHDLGAAVGSLGCMAQLVRTRQAEFELGKNVFEFDDLAKGEEVWGPEIKRLLPSS